MLCTACGETLDCKAGEKYRVPYGDFIRKHTYPNVKVTVECIPKKKQGASTPSDS